jgi:ParB-like chromosome segregation protein Spo0J
VSVTEPTKFDEGLRTDFSVALLRESDDNPRWIAPEKLEDLKYAIATQPDMLEARPIIADEYGVVICGNMRLRAASEMGWSEVPTYIHHFTSDAERREWMLRDNQEYGDWVPDQLAAMVAEHVQQGADVRLLGFGEEEIAQMVMRASGDALVPEPSEPPTPELAAEVMIEIRCSKRALAEIQETLEDWSASVDELEIAVSS